MRAVLCCRLTSNPSQRTHRQKAACHHTKCPHDRHAKTHAYAAHLPTHATHTPALVSSKETDTHLCTCYHSDSRVTQEDGRMHKHSKYWANTSPSPKLSKSMANRKKEKGKKAQKWQRRRATGMVECGFTTRVIPRFVYTPRSEVKF